MSTADERFYATLCGAVVGAFPAQFAADGSGLWWVGPLVVLACAWSVRALVGDDDTTTEPARPAKPARPVKPRRVSKSRMTGQMLEAAFVEQVAQNKDLVARGERAASLAREAVKDAAEARSLLAKPHEDSVFEEVVSADGTVRRYKVPSGSEWLGGY